MDLVKPHTNLLPRVVADREMRRESNPVLPALRSQSGQALFADNTIFKTRMVHPSGTMIGERMQKHMSLLEIKRDANKNESQVQSSGRLGQLKDQRGEKNVRRVQSKLEHASTKDLVEELQKRRYKK